jgi:hypothetical protein
MSTIIQIKRSQSTNVPTGLANGEFAYSFSNDKLFIGQTDSATAAVTNDIIGGAYFTNMLDQAHGTLTANSAMVVDSNKHIDEVITAGLTLEASGGSANTMTAVLNDSMFNTSNDSTLATSSAIKAYVDSQSANVQLDMAGNIGTGTVDVADDTMRLVGNNDISTSFNDANNTIVFGLTDTGVSAASYGSATAIPNITVDAKGRITALSTSAISSTLDIAADSGTDDGVQIGSDTLTISGTANEVVTSVSGDTITIGLPDDVTIGGQLNVSENAVISGNLVVDGTLSYLNTTNLAVQDPLIKLANNNTADTVDIGFYGKYSTTKVAGLFRDASDSGKFKLFNELTVDPTTTVNTGGSGYAAATLVLGTLELGTDLAVAHGGTGASTFTSNGILYGNGASALQVTAAGSEGKVLQAGSGGTPEFGDLDGGTF